MALIFLGSSVCSLCGRVLEEDDDVYGFPAFTGNPKDPLYPFNDAGFHRNCLAADSQGRKAMALMEEQASKTGPGNRKCRVCGAEILSHDECTMVGYICAPEAHSVAEFNYTHLHRSHVDIWPRKADFLARLEDAWRTGVLPLEWAEYLLKYLGLAAPDSWKAVG